MTESKVSVADRELAEAEKWLAYLNAFDKGGRLMIEEGLWVGMGIDILLVTGEVHSDSILFSQREALVGMFAQLDAMSTKTIPILKDINPLSLLNAFVSPLGTLVGYTLPDEGYFKKTVKVGVTLPIKDIPVLGVAGWLLDLPDIKVPLGQKVVTLQNYYYPALPMQYRVILALLVPGILRTIFKFLSSTMKVP